MVRNFFALLLVIGGVFFTTSCATETNKLKSNKSTLNSKVVLYIIKREGCPACVYQEKVVRVKEVKEILDRYCIVNYIDVREQDSLPKEWMHTFKTPTVHFVDSSNSKLIPSIGSVYPYEFRDALLKAKDVLDKRRGVKQ